MRKLKIILFLENENLSDMTVEQYCDQIEKYCQEENIKLSMCPQIQTQEM